MSLRRRCAHNLGPLWAVVAVGLIATAPPATGEPTTVTRGPVTAQVSVEPASVKIGDTVTLTLAVNARAGVELLLPSFAENLEQFEIIDFVPSHHIDEQGDTVATQRYRIYAGRSGEHAIAPLLIEFIDRRPGEQPAPQGEDAYELLTDPLAFTVTSVVPSGAGTALKPLPGPLEERAGPGATTSLWWYFAIFAALALALGLWAVRRRVQPGPITAYQRAHQRLVALRRDPYPTTGDHEAMDAFFVELSSIVRHYVEGRFGVQAPELTTEEFLDAAARSPDLTRPHRGFLTRLLQTADEVKFAHRDPTLDDAKRLFEAVEAFIEDTGHDARAESGVDGGSGDGEGQRRSGVAADAI